MYIYMCIRMYTYMYIHSKVHCNLLLDCMRSRSFFNVSDNTSRTVQLRILLGECIGYLSPGCLSPGCLILLHRIDASPRQGTLPCGTPYGEFAPTSEGTNTGNLATSQTLRKPCITGLLHRRPGHVQGGKIGWAKKAASQFGS